MATYQDSPGYQTYQVNPYQAPNQAIVQAIQTRGQYWDSAASNLKYAYQNYLNLDLTRQDNHDQLNQLMVGVNQQLKQVTQTDLSLGENYGKALNIFDPIVKNDNIMGDNAITKHYKDQFNIGQQYRIKDNGKEYSDTNMRDLSNHLQDFANDPNASNWRQHYSQRAFYTPYTDVAAETRQIGKDFKPDTTSFTVPQYIDQNGKITSKGGSSSGWMTSETNKSIVASQYRAFLDAHLSDKAKDQLALEGRVKYHDNIGALAQDYTSQNQDQMNVYNKDINDLTVKRNAATPDQKSDYDNQINKYQALVKELGIENTKMSSGDFSNLTPYKNQIAANIYTNKYTDYVARSSQQKNIDVKYTPDQVWKTMYQEDNENKRFNIAKDTQLKIAEMNNDTKLEMAGFKMNLKFGMTPGLNGIPGYGTADTSNDKSFGIDKFNEMQANSEKQFSDATNQLNNQIKAQSGVDMADASIPADKKKSASDAFFNDPRNKYDVQQFNIAAQKRTADQQTWSAINDWADKTLANTTPDAFNYRENILKGINQGQSLVLTPIKGGNSIPLNLSADDIRKIATGTHPNIKTGEIADQYNLFQGPGMGGGLSSMYRTLTYNGKEYKYSGGPLDQVLSKLEGGAQDYTNKRNDLLNQNITKIAGMENLFQNDKNPYYNAAHQITLREITGSGYEIKPEDVSLVARDRDGDVYFKVQKSASSNIDMDKVRTRVEAEGGKYIKADDTFMLPGTKYGMITNQPRFQDPRLGSIQTLVDFRSSATPNDVFSTVPQTWGSRNFSFKVDIQNGQPVYRITDPYTGAIFGQSDSGEPFSTLESAGAAANILGRLDQDNYINKVRTIGGVPTYQPK